MIAPDQRPATAAAVFDPVALEAQAARKEAKPLRDLDDDTFIKRMDRAQRLSRGALSRHFGAGLANLREQLDLDDIVDAMRRRRLDEILDPGLWDELRLELRVPLTASAEAREILEDDDAPLADLFGLKDSHVLQTWMAAARAVAALDPSEADAEDLAAPEPRSQGTFAFERLRPDALRYVDLHGAELVAEITEGTQAALRFAIRRAWEEPTSAGQLQRLILSLEDADGLPRLGLTRHQQGIFERWIDANLDGGHWRDWGQSRIQRQIDARYRGMVRRRSTLISLTESLEAGNAGQLRTWQSQVEQGAVEESQWLLEWVTRIINVCPRCQAMDGATRRINGGAFVSDGSGPKGTETADMPELHPGGYCLTRRMPADLVEPPRAA